MPELPGRGQPGTGLLTRGRRRAPPTESSRVRIGRRRPPRRIRGVWRAHPGLLVCSHVLGRAFPWGSPISVRQRPPCSGRWRRRDRTDVSMEPGRRSDRAALHRRAVQESGRCRVSRRAASCASTTRVSTPSPVRPAGWIRRLGPRRLRGLDRGGPGPARPRRRRLVPRLAGPGRGRRREPPFRRGRAGGAERRGTRSTDRPRRSHRRGPLRRRAPAPTATACPPVGSCPTATRGARSPPACTPGWRPASGTCTPGTSRTRRGGGTGPATPPRSTQPRASASPSPRAACRVEWPPCWSHWGPDSVRGRRSSGARDERPDRTTDVSQRQPTRRSA